jgi:hypothetical protein
VTVLPSIILFVGAAAFFSVAGFSWLPQASKLDQLQARYQQETDPVRRARELARLGPARLDAMRKEIEANNIPEALGHFRRYRDDVLDTVDKLKKSGINAEKRPAGFKNLQIHLRQALDRLETMLLSVSVTEREPFLEIQRQLERADEELIGMLFPRQPTQRPPQKSGR